jgi:hypothetical protein
MTSVLGVRAPTMVIDNHHLTGRGWAPSPTGPRHQIGGVSANVDGCLGLLLVIMLMIACWWV